MIQLDWPHLSDKPNPHFLRRPHSKQKKALKPRHLLYYCRPTYLFLVPKHYSPMEFPPRLPQIYSVYILVHKFNNLFYHQINVCLTQFRIFILFNNFPSPPEPPSFGNDKITQIENLSINGELEHYSSLSLT